MNLIAITKFTALAHLIPVKNASAVSLHLAKTLPFTKLVSLIMFCFLSFSQQHKLRGGYSNKETTPYKSKSPNPDIFQSAISLDDFRDVNPDQFEWVNPDEIQPGQTTCGFLKAPLGWQAGDLVVYPMVKTYVCITFATEQPAPRGNVAVHCGGPGSLSLCNYSIWLQFDAEARCE